MAESYNRTLVETTAAMLLIAKSVGVLANYRRWGSKLHPCFLSPTEETS